MSIFKLAAAALVGAAIAQNSQSSKTAPARFDASRINRFEREIREIDTWND